MADLTCKHFDSETGVSIAGLSTIILCRMNIVHDFSACLTLANFA